MFDRQDDHKFSQNFIANKNRNSRITPNKQIRNG
jgi:hypothetical protein